MHRFVFIVLLLVSTANAGRFVRRPILTGGGISITCGNTTGNGVFDNGNSGYEPGIKCTTGTNGNGYTLQSCSILLLAAAGNIKCAIYNGTAGAKLCESAVASATPNGVNSISLSGAGCPTINASTSIYVAFNFNNDTTQPNTKTNCSQVGGTTLAAFSAFPTMASSLTLANGCDYSMYATLTAN